MAEGFRNIEDETLPSFFMDSLMSDSSRMLHNVSLSSNLGVPVAASTVVKSKTGSDRHCDVYASYLEEGRISPKPPEPYSHSMLEEDNTKGKRDSLSKDDDMNEKCCGQRVADVPSNVYLQESDNTCSGQKDNNDTSFGLLPLEQMQDLSIGICTLPLLKKGKKIENAPQLKRISNAARLAACDNRASLSSFLENEKLLSNADVDDCATDDDVGDELFGNQVEEYFERLAPPDMKGDVEGWEFTNTDGASQLTSNVSNQGYDDYRTSFRLYLEGGNSDEDLELRRSTEGQTIPFQMANFGFEGDESIKSEAESLTPMIHSLCSNPQDVWAWKTGLGERNVAGEEGAQSVQSAAQETLDAVNQNDSSNPRLNSAYGQQVDSGTVFQHLDAHNSRKLVSSAKQHLNLEDLTQNLTLEDHLELNEDGHELGLAEVYLSPTSGRRAVELHNNYEKSWEPHKSSDVGEYADVDPHSSVVYQNEKGKWVTDLAYYTPFEINPSINKTPALENITNEDFISASTAMKMIEEDQKEFEKEHQFIQEEVMDINETTFGLRDTSWRISTNSAFLSSRVPPEFEEDSRYQRLSLGEFFGQRSEALGCLGGEFDGKRPSFGYYIRSPEKQDPVALLRQSCASRDFSDHNETTKCDETLLTGDLQQLRSQHSWSGFTTFTIEEVGSDTENDSTISTSHSQSSKSDKEQHSSENMHKLSKPQAHDSDSLLSISTIASAIANASTSADPSQLAAMIMALSNKDRKHSCVQSHDTCVATKSQMLPNFSDNVNVVGMLDENSPGNGSYLSDLTWEVPHSKPIAHSPRGELLTSTSKLKKDEPLACMDLTESPIQKFTYSMTKEPQLSEKLETQQNRSTFFDDAPESRLAMHPLPKSETVISNTGVGNNSTGQFGGSHKKRQTKHSATKLPKTFQRTSEASIPMFEDKHCLDVSTTNHDETSSSYNSKSTGSSDMISRTKLDTAPLRESNFPRVSPNKGRSVHKSVAAQSDSKLLFQCIQKKLGGSKVLEEVGQLHKEVGGAGTCKSKSKHVNFKNVIESDQNIDSKSNFKHKDNSSEDEQYIFRPSTSPLIHSSPSQDSITPIPSGSGDSPTDTLTSVAGVPYADSLSSCSSASISRLTYISVMDNTLQNAGCIPSIDEKMSNNTFQLSTTIIRASPTPSEEYAGKNTSEKVLCKLNEERTDANASTRNAHITFEGLKSKHVQSNEDCSKGPTKSKGSEMNFDSQTLSSKEKSISCDSSNSSCVTSTSSCSSSFSCNAKPVNLNNASTWPQSNTNTNAHVVGHIDLRSSNAVQTALKLSHPGYTYVPITNFQSVVSSAHVYAMPSGVPARLAGFSGPPLAEQFLGTLPSSVNIGMPQYQFGPSANFAVSDSLLDPSSQAGHMVNCVHIGANYGSDIAPGLLNGQPLATAHWDTRRSSGFEHVKVPEEIRFPNPCCVGIASQTSFSMFNPSGRWLHVNIGTHSISVNGEKIDPLASQCLVYQSNFDIGPRAATDVKILFVPRRSGVFQCALCVSSWPAFSNEKHSEVLATKVILTAFAETPSIQVDTGKAGCLEFGDLTPGSWKALPLKLINKSQVTVPIRLIISANAVAWPCFAFCNEAANLTTPAQGDRTAPLSFASLVSHVMHACYNGQDSEILTVWVYFRAPKSENTEHVMSASFAKVEDFDARVDVELDSAGPSYLLTSVPLRARTGTVRVHIPQELKSVYLRAQVGTPATKLLPLKNAGNISIELKIQCSGQDGGFSVEPQVLFLMPEEEKEVKLSFASQNADTKANSVLTIMVQPSGPAYDVMLNGCVDNTSATFPVVLTNKQFMTWGGVALGQAILQKLTLRNTANLAQHLRLAIKGQDQDCFQLHSIHGTEERLTHNTDISVKPNSDHNISLMFKPLRVSCMLAKLEIKHTSIRPSQPGIKFTIPLSGYGGKSNIILENVEKHSQGYIVTLNGISVGKMSKATFILRNTGLRAAFVKAVCFSDLQNGIIMDSSVIDVSPGKLVVLEQMQEIITVTCRSSPREQNLSNSRTSLLSTICFLCGDEVSRQQFRRALVDKPEAAREALPDGKFLKNINFDEAFKNEILVKEVYTLSKGLNDMQLFYGAMQRVVLKVLGSTTPNTHGASASQEHLGLGSATTVVDGNIENTSLDVLPVKGPQGLPLHLCAAEQALHAVDSQQTWAIQPETLLLTAHSASQMDEPSHLKILNYTGRALKFELSWPAHCLTITPHHGVVEPQSNIFIFVSPNPSLASKLTALPWSGQVYVRCNNEEKYVKVKIRSPSVKVAPVTVPASNQLTGLSSKPNAPAVPKKKVSRKSLAAHIEVKDKTIMFPTTASGSSTESCLEIQNPTNGDVKWYLSSHEPACVRGLDTSGDDYRANYTAFRFSQITGTLEAGERAKVSVVFYPRERGNYAQYWDLECITTAEPNMKHNLRIHLCGKGINEEHKMERASSECTLQSETALQPRRRSSSEASAFKPGNNEMNDEAVKRGFFVPKDLYMFPPTCVGECSTLKVHLQNSGSNTLELKIIGPKLPFKAYHPTHILRARHFVNVPVKFKPESPGQFEGALVVHTDDGGSLQIQLLGEAVNT